MPTEVFEDVIEGEVWLMDVALPDPSRPELHRSSYPLPALHPIPPFEARKFRTIVLENAFLKATLLPGLGGRLHSLFDKRTGLEILDIPVRWQAASQGPRGASIASGLQVRFGDQDRLNSLGHVEALLPPPGEEDLPGSAILGELGYEGLSFHLTVSLPADRAELILEVRAFNRTFSPISYNGGICLPWSGECMKVPGGFALHDPARNVGLAIFPGETPMDSAILTPDDFTLQRFASAAKRTLAPRQLDVWTLRLVPISGIAGLSTASPEMAIAVAADGCQIQTVETRLGHKLLLLTEDGQTLEAPADLYPETVSEIAFSGLPSRPVALVVQSPGKIELLRFDSNKPPEPLSRWETMLPPDAVGVISELNGHSINPSTSTETLVRATFLPATRSLAHTLLGMRSLATKDFGRAATFFEQALLFNAEDHLTWWLRALAVRMAGDEDVERPELLNAHFLAPLEPALRAEGFLSLPDTHGKEPNPLLAPLEDNPDSFVEVACLLLECGLFDQATKWIGEALRHEDMAMLRYLLAYAYLSASRMRVEAAEQVAAASRLPDGPPYPWRHIEIAALRTLAEAFPTDLKIKSFLGLIQAFRPM